MTISEVFPNPTVKQVIFQIRFPNLFYIENKIGDYQLKIMKQFPKSSIIFKRKILFADVGPDTKIEDISPESDDVVGKKIWQFESPEKYKMNILSDSLDIYSFYHKTYNNPQASARFREIIKFAVDNFLDIIQIPVINRIGLRYIDECPIPAKNNDSFLSFYNTTFPLNRFKIQDANEMSFSTTIKKNEYFLRYSEALIKSEDKYKLILDFDGYAIDIDSKDYLNVADSLHELASEEFEKSIKEPVYEYMRNPKED